MATALSPPQREEALSPQQMMQVASMDNPVRETDPQVLRVAAQLSWLASQHHASEYNQLKFGGKGSPAVYIPLSIQLPFHVKELRVYQQMNAQRQAWWRSLRRVSQPTPMVALGLVEDAPVIQAGVAADEQTSDELQEALSLAISSPLPPLPTHLHLLTRDPISAAAKTSETHPINMSPMVPFELLLRLSIYLNEPLEGGPPTHLRLPYELTLDALTTPDYLPSPPIPPPTLPAVAPAFGKLAAIPPSVIQADIHTDVPTPPPAAHRSPKLSNLALDAALIPLPPSPYDERGAFISQPYNGLSSENVTPAPQGAQTPSYFSRHHSSSISEDIREAVSTIIETSPPPIHIQRPSAPEPLSPPFPYVNGLNGNVDTMPKNDPRCTVNNIAESSARLGNLLLSSCPGKKVRLHGPVKGRGTIYRNLERDLKRVRDSGVGCIVCCLDDGELHFLGVPWEDYVREAHQLGLDILRLPTPEGFAPLDVRILNEHLDALINQYTLRGVSILVHCRGGVGRAGLIACCWMLKMGLCGWIRKIDRLPSHDTLNIFLNNHLEVSPDAIANPPDPMSDMTGPQINTPPLRTGPYTNGRVDSPQAHTPIPNYQHALERIESVDLVERVIRVVRRRRSVKAIETFEQVHFLVQFVEFLRRTESNRQYGGS